MVTTQLSGGLGNNLFQISAAYSLSIKNKDVAIFNENGVRSPHSHINTYKSNILRNVSFGKEVYEKSYNEPFFHYQEIPYTKNMVLLGYFQSEKYFIDNENEIRNLFSIDEKSFIYLKEKYNDINFEESCSLHVRRGDYLYYPTIHPTCSINYYHSALELIDSKNILIFSDDIFWCKNNLNIKNKNVIYISDNPDYIDLWLISLCKNNIMANSSFSWWGAWLNQNKNKKVIAPSIWFGFSLQHNTKDLYFDKTIII